MNIITCEWNDESHCTKLTKGAYLKFHQEALTMLVDLSANTRYNIMRLLRCSMQCNIQVQQCGCPVTGRVQTVQTCTLVRSMQF